MDVTVKIDERLSTFVGELKKRSMAYITEATAKEMPLSKEAKKYKRILKTMSRNCDTDVVHGLCRILSVMTDEEIVLESKSKGGYSKFMVIVPTSCPNGHDYEINDPVLIYRGDQAIDFNHRKGNHLPSMSTKAIRLAKEEEIDKFFDTFTITGALMARQHGTVTVIDDLRRALDISDF